MLCSYSWHLLIRFVPDFHHDFKNTNLKMHSWRNCFLLKWDLSYFSVFFFLFGWIKWCLILDACDIFLNHVHLFLDFWQRELSKSYEAQIKQLQQDLSASKNEVTRVESNMAEALAVKNSEIEALVSVTDALKKQAAISEGNLASLQVCLTYLLSLMS